jgi:hypothetical protein
VAGSAGAGATSTGFVPSFGKLVGLFETLADRFRLRDFTLLASCVKDISTSYLPGC